MRRQIHRVVHVHASAGSGRVVEGEVCHQVACRVQRQHASRRGGGYGCQVPDVVHVVDGDVATRRLHHQPGLCPAKVELGGCVYGKSVREGAAYDCVVEIEVGNF